MVITDPTKVCRIQHLTTNSQSQGHNFGSNLVRNLIYWHSSQPPSPKFKVTTSTQMSVRRALNNLAPAYILSVNEKLPASKFQYFGKYIVQLFGYCYVHVSGQRHTGLER